MLLYTTTYYIIQLSSFTRGEMKWVGGFGVQGSGLWWRLRRKYIWGDARRFAGGRFPSYRQPSPRGEGGERSEPDRVLAG